MLVMLDTPLPLREPLSRKDRLLIRLAETREGGFGYIRQWVGDRIRYEVSRRAKTQALEAGAQAAEGAFHDLAIEAAFLSWLPGMTLTEWDGPVAMFRPPLDPRFRVSGGRHVTSAREYLLEDNGWGPWMPKLRVIEVPGDHDSMVLEPNVRRMASVLRKLLRDADGEASARAQAAE